MIPTVVANAARKQTGSFLFDAEEALFDADVLGLIWGVNPKMVGLPNNSHGV